MDSPGIVVIQIHLKKLASAEVVAFGILSHAKVAGVGIGLEGPRHHPVIGIGDSYPPLRYGA